MLKSKKYDRQGFEIKVDGMAAINKHNPPSKATIKLLKKNGSLAEYQARYKKTIPTDDDEKRVSQVFKNLLNN